MRRIKSQKFEHGVGATGYTTQLKWCVLPQTQLQMRRWEERPANLAAGLTLTRSSYFCYYPYFMWETSSVGFKNTFELKGDQYRYGHAPVFF